MSAVVEWLIPYSVMLLDSAATCRYFMQRGVRLRTDSIVERREKRQMNGPLLSDALRIGCRLPRCALEERSVWASGMRVADEWLSKRIEVKDHKHFPGTPSVSVTGGSYILD
jgi:hypothetical protein